MRLFRQTNHESFGNLRLVARKPGIGSAFIVTSLIAALAIPVGIAFADDAGTRPPQCASHFKDRNVRERTIHAPYPGANLHEMSNNCAAAGQNLNILSDGSHFRLYYADPVQTYMCYGYSYQTRQNGYVYCSVLG